VGVFCTQRSMEGVFRDVLNLYSYEVHVAFTRPVRPERIAAGAAQVPGITHVESWVITYGTRVRPNGVLGTNISLSGPPPDQETVVPTLLEGRWLLPEDGNAVVVSAGVLDQEPDLAVGKDLTLEIGSKESSWRIVGVYLSGDSSGYVNSPALARAAGMAGRANRAVIKIAHAEDPLAQQEVARMLEERYERAGLPVDSSLTIHEVISGSLNQINMVAYLMLIVAVLLAVVGGLGLAATMGLNVLERTREIGVLRAIGASSRSTFGIVLAEGIVIGLLSGALGTLLSVPIGRLLSYGVGKAFLGAEIKHVYSWLGVGLWLVVAAVVSAAASLWPARRASRISVREALAYE
jgi:putative ABC transport system permease protein